MPFESGGLVQYYFGDAPIVALSATMAIGGSFDLIRRPPPVALLATSPMLLKLATVDVGIRRETAE